MLNAELLKPIKNWKKDGLIKLVIGCDVGGSGLRVRLNDFNNPKNYVDCGHAKAQRTSDALAVLNDLQTKISSIDSNVKCMGASMAVAGPIKDGTVVMTNWLGKPSVRTLSLKQLPKDLFPHGKSIFLNDLEAGAYGVIAANQERILDKHFEQLFTDVAPKGSILSDTRTALMAMGSGLGVAILYKNPYTKEHLVLPTEFGHLQIAPTGRRDENSGSEYRLIQHVSDHYYAGTQAPEYEDISSGRGLCLTYQHFHLVETGVKIPLDQIDAGEIAHLAKTGDKIARQSLLKHYTMFMRNAKAVATTMSCDSILLALDNQVKNSWFVTSITRELKNEFYNFIRPDWMKGIRVYHQNKVLNFNILGTSYTAYKIAHN